MMPICTTGTASKHHDEGLHLQFIDVVRLLPGIRQLLLPVPTVGRVRPLMGNIIDCHVKPDVGSPDGSLPCHSKQVLSFHRQPHGLLQGPNFSSCMLGDLSLLQAHC